jgi:hypothetical protein
MLQAEVLQRPSVLINKNIYLSLYSNKIRQYQVVQTGILLQV